MQIPYKPVGQACDVLEIFMLTSKAKQIDLKFLFIQLRLAR